MLVRLNTGCARTLMVFTGSIEISGCTLYCGYGVTASTNIFNLKIFCALVGVVLSCGYNSESIVKGTTNSGSLSTLGRTVTVSVGGYATTCSRSYCVMIDADSSRRLSMLAPVAATVVTAGLAFVT